MAKDNKKANAARRHTMPTTLGGYENLLISMIEKRTGSEFDEFLLPQVSACAQTWMMMNRVYRDLMKAKKLVDTVLGSQNQQKDEVNPLLPYYLKLQAELRLQFQALGLNWNSTPSKIKEDVKKGVDTEKDGLSNLLTQARDTMNEIPDIINN